ncbi:nucleoside deaminase [Paludisphaera soli]|uniref:nucleoside deaminase n=1 Tax=Paludisphaera soli TaxID=2712865 RepID=UPI0013EB3493|nr:nucleoside deaminase [Paludisphaera soli]
MDFIGRLIELARDNVEAGGRPFACLIVRDGAILVEAVNLVAQTHDPTAHAEICAIREASARLGTEDFRGCEFYILAHPCPMCLAAMYYCGPDRVTFVATREDYAPFYADDRRYFTLASFYDEIARPWPERLLPMVHEPDDAALDVYRLWRERNASG